ncbi:MAG: histidine--tRNA ligase [Clostridiales Family XIII bacterium]|jgi:histidyl-tRNA synthetase|nr:histidine--tRNA ligase [Clostridiales Family XIII bacterium]
MLTAAPKGTKDILPDQIYKWQFVEKKFRELAEKYGYKELRTPTIEHTELFARGVGGTTDIVEKQMYSFEDYGGRNITLRPEGTAGAARSYLEHKEFAAGKPSKYWYEIPCFRYEKPQSGRLREFHQFGLEVFGSSDMLSDADVISFADEFLRTLGVTELVLKVNSIGCPNCRPIYRQALKDFLSKRYDELCDTCKVRFEKNPMRILDCKSPVCQDIAKGAPVMLDYLCDECKDDFESLKVNLQAAKIEYEVDPLIVRGLDYYTKTAFEFVSESIGAQGTVCGGGRYDHLIEQLGGGEIPGVGFGLGIERLILVLEASGVTIPKPAPTDALVVFLSDETKPKAIEIAAGLRSKGLSAELDLCGRGMKAQFKYADREGVRFAVVLGDEELRSGEATLKDMESGEQRRVAFELLTAEIGR